MKLKLFLPIGLCILLSPSLCAQINSTFMRNVPFQIISINPGHELNATYNFHSHQGMFCYDDTFENVGRVTFPHHDRLETRDLPLIMTNKTDIEGGVQADPSGSIVILNTQKHQIMVSCNFLFGA